jgi:hypothetical protein
VKATWWWAASSLALAAAGCQRNEDIVALGIASPVSPAPSAVAGAAGSGGSEAQSGAGGGTQSPPSSPAMGGEGTGGSVDPDPPSLPPGYCDGPYPVVELPVPLGGVRSACVADLARDRFAQALCSCNDTIVAGSLTTDAFDSRVRVSNPGGASVGINGSYTLGQYAKVDGSFTVTGRLLLTWKDLDISGDLRLAPFAISAGKFTIGRDAWLETAPTGLASGTIGRDLYLNSTRGTQPFQVAGETVRGAFEIKPPCRCEDTEKLGISALLAQASDVNDNAAAGLDATLLTSLSESVELTLSCGRYFLPSIDEAQRLSVKVTGNAALFVQGDVALSSSIQLEEGAELDLFVGGEFRMSKDSVVGTPERAGAVRLYAGGRAPIELPRARFAGNLYAPEASVKFLEEGDFYGSVFAKDVSSGSPLVVHYDRYVLAAGDACPTPPAESCDGCDQCRTGLACRDGECAACTGDEDCCSPLVCSRGRCEPLVRGQSY